ncbi:transmembrane protein, putative [Medicago truncatula]|uniref:Transmembrane protein, putative n=1 Tax=Medicago truncatula TaxID=3880 RepID=A0A072V8H0_MEDTR|nr:transmembrane protein, putative [Medicago truncatula]
MALLTYMDPKIWTITILADKILFMLLEHEGPMPVLTLISGVLCFSGPTDEDRYDTILLVGLSVLLFTGVFCKLRANSDYYKRDRTRNLRTCCAKVLIENGLKKATRCTQVT